ncbi:hypothetical protein [Halopelagius fulvigenes]|uniref:Uncharacterized protein n=1 Tax=Halopelagius fulvigenes TaxID=1198324 RepID=A0ABD5U1H6_9EURY
MALPDGLVHHERPNAILGWASTGVVVLGSVESLLTNAILWGGFALFIAAVVAVPAFSTGEWTVIVPWPLPLFAAVAVLVRSVGVYPEIAGYVAIATLALVVVVELDAFTSVEMSRRFAVGFAVLTTMAIQGLWTVAQFYSDMWLGTKLLRSQTELQWDFVIVTAVGLVEGGIFERYFERFSPAGAAEQSVDARGSS